MIFDLEYTERQTDIDLDNLGHLCISMSTVSRNRGSFCNLERIGLPIGSIMVPGPCGEAVSKSSAKTCKDRKTIRSECLVGS